MMPLSSQLALEVHGFRVLSARPLSQAFKRALKELAACDYLDPSCTIVKTAAGAKSGITHAGGRYLHSANLAAPGLASLMREQGIEPPALPFVVAPGPAILFHEWGHHVDRVWSGEDQDVTFSFKWFSDSYELLRMGEALLSQNDAVDAIVAWRGFSSELFASLFEDWMREPRRVPWDECDPRVGNAGAASSPCVSVKLLAGSAADIVRSRTYALFERGLGQRVAPKLRVDLLGPQTAGIIEALPAALDRIRAGVGST